MTASPMLETEIEVVRTFTDIIKRPLQEYRDRLWLCHKNRRLKRLSKLSYVPPEKDPRYNVKIAR